MYSTYSIIMPYTNYPLNISQYQEIIIFANMKMFQTKKRPTKSGTKKPWIRLNFQTFVQHNNTYCKCNIYMHNIPNTTQPSVPIEMDGNLPCKSTETRSSKSGGNSRSVYPVTDLVDNSLYYSLIH